MTLTGILRKEEGLGNLYEGLLEQKMLNEEKSQEQVSILLREYLLM